MGSHESGVNHFNQNVMGLSEFPDTLSPVIFYFGGDIGDGGLCSEISPIRCCRRRFSYFVFL
jgi:hypothetical protein